MNGRFESIPNYELAAKALAASKFNVQLKRRANKGLSL